MLRKPPMATVLVTTALLAALVIAGGGDRTGSTAADAAARTAVERAAGVELAETSLIEAEHGLLSAWSNLDDSIADEQTVMLLVLDETARAAEIGERIQPSLPAEAETLEHENLVVFYASEGEDRSAAIEKALAAL
jgi:hypothetical protein